MKTPKLFQTEVILVTSAILFASACYDFSLDSRDNGLDGSSGTAGVGEQYIASDFEGSDGSSNTAGAGGLSIAPDFEGSGGSSDTAGAGGSGGMADGGGAEGGAAAVGGSSGDGGAGGTTDCKSGINCSPAECQYGQTSCANEASECSKTGNLDNGTVCSDGGVCFAGACVSCPTGTDCSEINSCRKKTYVCSSGESVCTASGNASDGTRCGTNLYCNQGACQSCTNGANCVPEGKPCNKGIVSCENGQIICSDKGTPVDVGTSCGDNQVCNSAGACVSCAANLNCAPDNPCHQGLTSCATGVATCVDQNVAVSNNTPCNDNNLCTQTDTCQSGICTGTNPVTCTRDVCRAAGTCDTSTGKCSAQPLDDNTQDLGCNGTCQACQGGSCSVANAGTDPGYQCPAAVCASGNCSGGMAACEYTAYGTKSSCGTCYWCDGNGPSCQAMPSGTGDTGCNRVANECITAAQMCNGTGSCNLNYLPSGYDCGKCAACTSTGDCTVYDSSQNTDCGFCQKCTGLGTCGSQSSSEDLKSECPKSGQSASCTTGNCNGAGDCGVLGNTTHCGTCLACNGSGSCSNTSYYQGNKDPSGCNSICMYCIGGSCVNFENNTQDPAGCSNSQGKCRACQNGSCGYASSGDPGNQCTYSASGTPASCYTGDCTPGSGSCAYEYSREVVCWRDNDADNYGDPSNIKSYCDNCGSGTGYVGNSQDCNDNDPSVYTLQCATDDDEDGCCDQDKNSPRTGCDSDCGSLSGPTGTSWSSCTCFGS